MFGFSFDRRTINIIIGVLLGVTILRLISNTDLLISILVSAPGVLIAITFHEYAHGLAAYKLGDNTAKDEGRLSLNPVDHLDPIGTLMLLIAGFGWGKPVHVNPTNYTRKISMEKGEAIVSVAGPAINIILAFVFTLIYFALRKFAYVFITTSTIGSILINIIGAAVSINIGLGVFNLLPLPPLDGSKIIKPFLPYKAKEWFENNEQIFYLVFIILWISGLAGDIITPAIGWITNSFLDIGRLIFGI